ncbi:MAG: AlpA family phage regulatory protein [Deltaproteobacteria bacterium]|nr:AlpA family phage regulatory protein [Deltaproteobacteria bacterium]
MSDTTSAPVVPTSAPRLLRLRAVLERVPVSRSTWWAGVASGRYPAPIRLSTRTTAWLSSDIDALIESLAAARK